MGIKMFQVDAFTDKPYFGNPAAVCLLQSSMDDRWMQLVAREMNLSETSFLIKEHDGYALRWFTPETEVDLCGHATLAAAHTLWECGLVELDEDIRFYTKSGLLTAQRNSDWIDLNFPEVAEEPCEAPEHLLEALGITAKYIGKNRFDYIVEVESEEVVKLIKPDFTRLGKVAARGIIVTSISTGQPFDFVSRCFYPAVGIDEDPVTGSAHCCLGLFWKTRLNKSEFTAAQLSQRGGALKIKLTDQRVILSGQAVTVMRGDIVQ